MAVVTLVGPAWSTTATPLLDAGRFPLGVETATLNNAARLVPLVNSGTAHARYYLLHHAIARLSPAAAGAADDLEKTRQLIRRAEVILAAASLRHAEVADDDHHGMTRFRDPHGSRVVHPALDEPEGLDVVNLAATYSKQTSGFLAVYRGAEIEAGLLDPLNATIRPGPVQVPDASLSAVHRIIAAATADTISTSELDALLPDACLCQVRGQTERPLLAHLFFDTPMAAGPTAPRSIRQARLRTAASAKLLLHALDGEEPGVDPTAAMTDLCVERLESVPADLQDWAQYWRGALLRNASVTAWRWLWWWLTDLLSQQPRSRTDLAEALAENLAAAAGSDTPAFAQLRESLPERFRADGRLVDVETDLLYPDGEEADDPWTYLQVLVLGTLRLGDLTNQRAREAFLEPGQLDPVRLAGWLKNRDNLTVRELGRELARLLLAKAEDISHERMRWEGGQLRVPTRLREIGNVLDLAGAEGSESPGLRLARMQQILEELGYLEINQGSLTWGAPAKEHWRS